ncbi:MAG: metallophosphoesterase family protein [Longimicrobiales bacterium]|nr:metallophosphoesterase family protein [Longimicrobiales bacterium]
MRLGLISDTHGRLRAEVFDAFEGVDRILHAGDIGPADLLVELEAIAPVTAVWGNTDGFDVRQRVEEVARLEAGGHYIAVIHGHQLGSPKPAGLRAALPDADIIVYGHTHRPLVEMTDGAAVINPGSAGAARFGLSPSVAILDLSGEPDVELIDLA